MNSAFYKSIIFLIIIFIISACSDSNERRGRMTPEEQLAQLTERLDLNAEQADKVKTILDEQRKKFSKMREDFSGDRSEMREVMMQSR
jgi:Spy/CpxP family protein refolding chaperone